MYLLDSNILLRLILNDQPDKTERCLQFISSHNNCLLSTVVIFECFQVLTGKRLQYSKQQSAYMISTILSSLQDLIVIEEVQLHIKAFDLVAQTHFDYVDCYLIAAAKNKNVTVVSYDKDFKKVTHLSVIAP